MSVPNALNGVFGALKPTIWTSRQVIDHAQKCIAMTLKEDQAEGCAVLSNSKPSLPKMGHGGTLDPLASGVLILGIGKGTKQLGNFLACSKDYIVTGRFGITTDSYDAQGLSIESHPTSHITRDLLASTISQFRGTILQIPPLHVSFHPTSTYLFRIVFSFPTLQISFSALRQNGQHLYTYAHLNIAPPKPIVARPVTIHSLELRSFEPPNFTLAVTCGGGTYMRSLVYDVGKACGSGAHVVGLVRTRQGEVRMEDCVQMNEVGMLERVRWAMGRVRGSDG